MINMDMVGRLNDSSKVLTIGGIGTSPSWPTLLKLNEQKVFTIKVDSSGTGPSDHTSFYRKDLPVLFFFTGLHTDYHKPSDDAERINYKGEVSIVNYIATIVESTPANDKLAFTKTREQQMGTGGRFKVSIGIMPDYTFSGQGVKADGVIDGRPAQKAGVVAGDVIIQLGEYLITSVETYMQCLNRFEKGQSTSVTVKRGKEVKEFPITF
jgi:C-terminal processing protease CtpA/Prc